MTRPQRILRIAGGLLCLAALASADSPSQPTVIDFDAVDATNGRVVATRYLAKHGITISDASPSTVIVIADANNLYAQMLEATSPRNVLSHINSTEAVAYTLNFPTPTQVVRFTRPKLLAGPTGITFPAWRAEALDEKGRILDRAEEPLGSGEKYYSDVPARTFTLKGPGIKAVRFSSDGGSYTGHPPVRRPFAGFDAIVIDDLILEP